MKIYFKCESTPSWIIFLGCLGYITSERAFGDNEAGEVGAVLRGTDHLTFQYGITVRPIEHADYGVM